MAATFDSLMGLCLVELPEAPQPLVTAALNTAARTLCLEAGIWEESQNITLLDGQAEYAPVAAAGAVARTIKSVMLNNRLLTPTMLSTVLETAPARLSMQGEPTHYFMTMDMKLHLMPIPMSAQAGMVISVVVDFVPAIDATDLSSVLVERFAETLMAGAKAKMMAMPGRAWSNPQLAAYWQNEFTQGVTRARIEKLTDYGRSDLKVKMPRFGGHLMYSGRQGEWR